MRFVSAWIFLWCFVGRNRLSKFTLAAARSTVVTRECRLIRLNFAACLCAVIAAGSWSAAAETDVGMVDLSNAVVVAPNDLSLQEKKSGVAAD